MKQSVSPAIIAVAVIGVLAVIGFFGYRYMSGSNRVSNSAKPPDTTSQMQQRYQSYGQTRPSNRTGMPPGMQYGAGRYGGMRSSSPPGPGGQ